MVYTHQVYKSCDCFTLLPELSNVFLVLAILMSVQWYFIVVLIFIFLIANKMDYFTLKKKKRPFKYLLLLRRKSGMPPKAKFSKGLLLDPELQIITLLLACESLHDPFKQIRFHVCF